MKRFLALILVLVLVQNTQAASEDPYLLDTAPAQRIADTYVVLAGLVIHPITRAEGISLDFQISAHADLRESRLIPAVVDTTVFIPDKQRQVTAMVRGLTPATTYYYRLVSPNVVGKVLSVTTSPAPAEDPRIKVVATFVGGGKSRVSAEAPLAILHADRRVNCHFELSMTPPDIIIPPGEAGVLPGSPESYFFTQEVEGAGIAKGFVRARLSSNQGFAAVSPWVPISFVK